MSCTNLEHDTPIPFPYPGTQDPPTRCFHGLLPFVFEDLGGTQGWSIPGAGQEAVRSNIPQVLSFWQLCAT